MNYIKLPVTIDLTPEQMIALLKGELFEAKVSSANEPNGIFYNMEEKKRILAYFGFEQ